MPVQHFRRLEYIGHVSTFWASLIAPGGKASCDSNGNKKTCVQLGQAEIPADVMADATPAQLEAATTEAVARSVQHFMSIGAAVRSPQGAELRDKVMLFEMKHVAMMCEGRSGPYDLLHYPHKDETYAADSRDESIVYVLDAVTATQLTEGIMPLGTSPVVSEVCSRLNF